LQNEEISTKPENPVSTTIPVNAFSFYQQVETSGN